MGYFLWYDDDDDDGTVQNIDDSGGGTYNCKHGLSFHMGAFQILLENLQRFVDDDDAEVESQIASCKANE